jgi:hypothetical protein
MKNVTRTFLMAAVAAASVFAVLSLTISPAEAILCPPYHGPMSKIFCGGIAGIECPDKLICVDDPRDDCCPEAGGADCGGMCVRPRGRR